MAEAVAVTLTYGTAEIDPVTGYIENIDRIRETEYPSLRDTVYLDHAGTTLYAKSVIEIYASELTKNLFGNPHSASASSQLSTRRIDDTRLQVLRYFNADPNEFDVVFVANATSAIKLVADAFRDAGSGFWYGYHIEAHTSLVGVRELATEGSRGFNDDQEVQNWISEMSGCHPSTGHKLQLFGYPGQSNMTGHKPPLAWCKQIRDYAKLAGTSVYTLYDAAGLLSTSSLDLSDVASAPDFVALSFYKIFGFPDLGALIVRKQSGDILRQRKYFAGGTVEMVTTSGTKQHAKKEALHSRLEDGTLAFHNIVALQVAMDVHNRLFGSITSISRHAFFLAQKTYRELSQLRHCNGRRVCQIYSNSDSFEDPGSQGSVISFNLHDSHGVCVGRSEVEKLAIVHGIQLRTGGLCNPGGTAKYLNLSAEQLQHHYESGLRCDDGEDSIDGNPTGTVRISFSAMSSLRDVKAFVDFVDEYYVEKLPVALPLTNLHPATSPQALYLVESLSVYPIKSCAAFKVPQNMPWEVKAKGLLWDREWCLVHEGTRSSLSQKRYPRMALLQPRFDLERRVLIITHEITGTRQKLLEISLDHSTATACDSDSAYFCQSSKICGEQVDVEIYTAEHVTSFFTEALGVPCTLARFPQIGPIRLARPRVPDRVPNRSLLAKERLIMLSNESPILLVSRSSVNRLNEQIKEKGSVGKAVPADSFRGNIVVAEELCGGQTESPYDEDDWQSLVIGNDEDNRFEVMGPCQRCQMVCVDQKSAQRRREPLSTLAKTRRKDGKVYFGIHMCLAQAVDDNRRRFVRVGDRVSAMSSHKPYINYAQYYKGEAPPQPAWAPPVASAQPPPRAGWADPRASQQYGQQPHQVPAPAAFSYNPNQYGPTPGASPAQSQAPQYTWGVRYQQQAQQHQQYEPTPPLPPRPSSTASRIDTPVAPYQSQTSTQWQGRPSDIQHAGVQPHTPGESWGAHNSQYHSQSIETPPPPPPRPAAYASNWPHEHYAYRPSSHHYEPSTNPNWNQALAEQHHVASTGPKPRHGYNNSGSQNQALVSPIDLMSSSWAQSADTTSQAYLSHATTYDHHHTVQTPLQEDTNFTNNLPIQAATAFAGPTSDWEHFAPEPYAVSPEIAHDTPADLELQTNMEEAIPAHVAVQSLPDKFSDARDEQHGPHNDGRATTRQESFSSNVSEQEVQRTGTIDSVIHAWNAPLEPRRGSLCNPSTSRSQSTHSAKPSIRHGQNQAHPQELRVQMLAPQGFVGQASDPYDDLEPQFRASLARFVHMLRKESAAESDQEKFKIFDTFLQKERRLRAVLYDVDVTPVRTDLGVGNSSRQPDNAPPVLEAKTEAAQRQSEAADASDKAMPILQVSEKQELPKKVATPPQTAFVKLDDSPKSKDDSFVMVDREQGDDAAAYSPGGRPLIPRPITVKTNMAEAPMRMPKPVTFSSQSSLTHSPSDNAPQVVGEDYASTVPESPALAAPIVLTPKHPEASPQLGLAATSNGPLSMPVKFEPTRPVYTPFRYAEGHEAQSDSLDVQHPPDQDYLSKRNTYDSSRLMHDVTPSLRGAVNVASPISTKKVQEEAFLGLIRSHSTARPKQKLINVPESIRPSTTPPSARIRPEPIGDAVRALRETLPPALPERLQTDKALQIRQRMEAFVDDFSFIRETVIPWDQDNRENRKKLDEERHKRQEESEIRLDELFNDNEIAYADLKGMEADFKLAEAERRYEEDKQELESFSKGVYEVVAARLQQQVDALNKEYVLAFDLLDLESDSAARMLTNNGGRSAMSDAMDIVLQLFEKLNIRYHKLAEARFERERRRKRLELTVLYTNGDSEGTKKLEKEFSTAEKLQVLHEARDKDRRSNQLMDSFERATVRGLGDSQAFLDELFAKIRKLNDVLPANGLWQQSATDSVYGQNGARNALASAQGVVDYILADSRALLTASNAADKTLNDADYAVSIAEAKAANADEATNSKLKADFLKEEGKLIEEMSMRMDSITKTPLDCANLIQEIISRVGDDGEHADRMKRALEQAKMRNAGGKET